VLNFLTASSSATTATTTTTALNDLNDHNDDRDDGHNNHTPSPESPPTRRNGDGSNRGSRLRPPVRFFSLLLIFITLMFILGLIYLRMEG
jgi:hypothetical protein